MVDLAPLLADLDAESADLDATVTSCDAEGWARPTPSPGWSVGHQIAHLAWTDHMATLAATDMNAFFSSVTDMISNPETYVDEAATAWLAPPAELLPRWRAGRETLAKALTEVPPGMKLPWFGTQMSAASMVTARIMETWAHGQDIADALGVTRTPTGRLRHIAYLGSRTLTHAFTANGEPEPAEPVAVELTAPDGTSWTFGPADAANRVTGTALDFCLLVTQRRHRADLALAATGPVADRWLDIAQAFAGPPGPGREPLGTAQTGTAQTGAAQPGTGEAGAEQSPGVQA